MRAEYEKNADLLVVELEPFHGPTEGEQHPVGPVIEFRDDRPVSIEVLSASSELQRKLEAVSQDLSLDLHAISAIADVAIRNPDSLVTPGLEVVVGEHLIPA